MMKNFLKNYLSTSSFILMGYMFLTNNPYYKGIITHDLYFIDFKINTFDTFTYIMCFYLLMLIPFYLIEKGPSKARISINTIVKKLENRNYKILPEEKTAILAWIVKLIFIPMMLTRFFGNGAAAFNNIYYMIIDAESISAGFREFFDNHLFQSIYWTIMFLDVMVFSIGYTIETKYLKNVIKSVEPTFFGWAVALVCYLPFFDGTVNLFGRYKDAFPIFSNTYIHVGLNILILILFTVYLRATFSLGFKGSNLTNRGIVTYGPYKYVRHPAYITKNIAWIIGTIPAFIITFQNEKYIEILLIILSTIAWLSIYYFRATTEENHLSNDKDYIAYKKNVKYKFIPKVY